ncbi:oxidoreductase [Nocardiopsis gilva YIM 90087]|uniref:Oxidoreductase n=1 Tax=Nocardiopsis gilva YIM 90087 TaxID=1235441 RepID=A0A223SAC2_9ACTN|nr:2-oxoglutarate and iron-dependent oxygenase domain-containing protein [Nocardiopsis gilva]ASU85065.1 oxidoreductase [Nocardiopsis gilva YIM 90087]
MSEHDDGGGRSGGDREEKVEKSTTGIPLLDLRDWHAPESRTDFAERLRAAAHGIGFVQLTGHGVDARRSGELLNLARRFFALPKRERLAVENIHSPHFRGYTAAGRELTGGRMDWRELFDVGRERAPVARDADDPPWLGLTGPNHWPSALPEMRPVFLDLLDELYGVGYSVLCALAAGLGCRESLFEDWFGPESHARLKLLHYPPRPTAEHEQGAGAHKDYGFLSIVIQDGQGGLQVDDGSGGWVDAAPVPGVVIVNFGETLELATGGYVLAGRHRVVSPPPDAERTSIAFFLNPRLDAEITPVPLPPALATEARGQRADPDNPVFTTYGRNEFKGWMRAHPRVARRHYPDHV